MVQINKMRKKSQMEILGLAIVVMLILVATIFVIKFFLLKKPAEYRKGFVTAELASNTLNAFLKTAAKGCSQLTMTELLQDCAQSRPDGTISCDSGIGSCTYVELAAKEIFRQTLETWSVDYEFLAYTDINSPLIKIGKPCLADKRSKLFPISISSGTMLTRLDICG